MAEINRSTAAPVDFNVSNHGSIFLLQPLTERATQWCKQHLPEDRQMWGASTVVEHRYIRDIVQGIIDDGMRVQ